MQGKEVLQQDRSIFSANRGGTSEGDVIELCEQMSFQVILVNRRSDVSISMMEGEKGDGLEMWRTVFIAQVRD